MLTPIPNLNTNQSLTEQLASLTDQIPYISEYAYATDAHFTTPLAKLTTRQLHQLSAESTLAASDILLAPCPSTNHQTAQAFTQLALLLTEQALAR